MRRTTLAAAALAGIAWASSGMTAEEATARIAMQNSSGVTLFCALDAGLKIITVRRARFKGAVEVPSGKVALYSVPAGSYRAVLPGTSGRKGFAAGKGAPTVVVLTRTQVGRTDVIEASVKGAKEVEVAEATEAEKAALREELAGKKKKVPTTEELMPLISHWTYAAEEEARREAEKKRRREEALERLETLLWAHYWAAPYYPDYDDPYFGRGHRARRTDDPLSYSKPRARFYRRFRPAIIVGGDDWSFCDGSIFVRRQISGKDVWLRWDLW